ncbi:hypothetical protein J4Q44_G00168080 [Coregonus suidteri]|uniref:Uncharacterized protein n=1 Tax=Coregonus suidteri TaxID=861788 RepID=A0AAN8QVY0_9TELE
MHADTLSYVQAVRSKRDTTQSLVHLRPHCPPHHPLEFPYNLPPILPDKARLSTALPDHIIILHMLRVWSFASHTALHTTLLNSPHNLPPRLVLDTLLLPSPGQAWDTPAPHGSPNPATGDTPQDLLCTTRMEHWQQLWSPAAAPLLWRELHPGGLSSANTALLVLAPASASSNLKETNESRATLLESGEGYTQKQLNKAAEPNLR